MTHPNPAALHRHNQRIAGMLTDPECVGELLLVGIAMARAVDLNDPPTQNLMLGHIADLALPRPNQRWRIRDVVRDDIRRYKTRSDWQMVTCGRPMVARAGLCNRNASHKRVVTDLLTGERTWVGACTNRPCRAWLDAVTAENRRQLAETPAPVPAANAGGVLDRHLPEIDWYAIWRHLDPKWTPPPEGRTWSRPTLTVLVEDEPETPVVPVARPALAVLEGGWW